MNNNKIPSRALNLEPRVPSPEPRAPSFLTVNDCLKKFLLSLIRRNYSKQSVRFYRFYIQKFFSYLNNKNRDSGLGVRGSGNDLKTVNRQIILNYWEHLKLYNKDGKHYSYWTICSCIKSLKQLFRYLKKQDLILMDPTDGLPEMPSPKVLPKNIMTKEEVESILNKPDTKTPLGFRDRAILETLYSTGIRRMELINLTIYDVDPHQGLIRVIQGKGKKDRIVPIGKVALNYIKEYLAQVRPKLQKDSKIKTLFITYRGTGIFPNHLCSLVRRYAREANIIKSIGPHAFRHTCATEMLKGGSSVSHVQAMLGHAHIKTTQIYTKVLPLDLKKIHQKTHPRERLKKKEVVPFIGENKR